MKTRCTTPRATRRMAFATALFLATGPDALASINGPYSPDAATVFLLHLDEDGTGGIAANAVSGGASFIATANPSAATPRNPTPGILGAVGASGVGFTYGRCANLSTANNLGLFIDANANGVADLDVSGSAPGGDAISGSTFTGPSGEFTLETLINLPSLTAGNREIISLDSSAGASDRPFQFRVSATGSIEFNNIAVSGANPKTPIPTTGPEAFVPDQWFHVALTYDGMGTITFYWTRLDNARTGATVLAVHTVNPLDISDNAVLTVGNENRNTSGEGLMGSIDEVRISNSARSATDMVFNTEAPPIPPSIDPQPTAQFLGVGETLSIVSHASGSTPLTYQWQKSDGTAFADIPGQTADTLSLPVTFATEGAYRYIVANLHGSATSDVAQVTIGAVFAGLFPTGVSDTGALLDPLAVDTHFTLWASADPAYLGPDTLVPSDIADYSANDNASQWICPSSTLGGVRGTYIYRTTFVIDTAVAEGSTLAATVLSGGSLTVVLNSQPTGVVNLNPPFPGPHRNLFSFTLNSGFVQGLNTLDFIVDNADGTVNSPAGNAMRVTTLRGIGQALPPGLSILTQPQSQTVREGGRVTFSCIAQGRPPLTYQWYGDTTLIPDAASRTLSYSQVLTGAQPTSFKVVVSDASGSVTSQTATLTLTSENQPVVCPDFTLVGFAGAPLVLPISSLLQAASDADGDPIQFAGFEEAGTNTVSPAGISQVNAALAYSNVVEFVGSDRFNVTLTDGLGGDRTLAVSVQVSSGLKLTVGAASANSLRLAWPTAATAQSFKLRYADTVDSPLTNTVTDLRVTEGNESAVYVAPANTARFYRLAYP